MPLYRVDRHLGQLSAAEIDAASYRSVACIPYFEGLRWLRSYYDATAGQMTCVYQAQQPDDIRKHADMAHIPCDAVTEVVEYLPDAFR